MNNKTFYDPGGKWKFEIDDKYKELGFIRFHKHENVWSRVKSIKTGKYDSVHGWVFVCNACEEPTPEIMEGFINLIAWDR